LEERCRGDSSAEEDEEGEELAALEQEEESEEPGDLSSRTITTRRSAAPRLGIELEQRQQVPSTPPTTESSSSVVSNPNRKRNRTSLLAIELETVDLPESNDLLPSFSTTTVSLEETSTLQLKSVRTRTPTFVLQLDDSVLPLDHSPEVFDQQRRLRCLSDPVRSTIRILELLLPSLARRNQQQLVGHNSSSNSNPHCDQSTLNPSLFGNPPPSTEFRGRPTPSSVSTSISFLSGRECPSQTTRTSLKVDSGNSSVSSTQRTILLLSLSLSRAPSLGSSSLPRCRG